ncbi:hypothetical protein [Paenibacillus oleatilyticus]|uniref:hypothetical protein n=1 Tax=Paenibacillus oleatilyticus TaxID=2594886 RepID=UPI001C1FCCE2|nr:hypothetical protein [Paenibacillus oleatilyticus]MBU7314056.1 hypothetical protein [Paenibacillus oleatilyticus]
MDAAKLAIKVRKVLQKQIRAKGYEVEAELLSPDKLNPSRLNISDTGENDPIPHKETIRIVVTSHELVENPTGIGDNPNEMLEFIVIEDGTEPERKRVQEGRILLYNAKRYNITLVSPATLAGLLIIKEVTAKAVK